MAPPVLPSRMKLAVWDLGTNSVRFLIARVERDFRFQVLDRSKEMVRLGRGTFETGYLDEATRNRAVEALVRFRRIADGHGVEHFLAVATSAVREALNGMVFLQEVHEKTGVRVRIISGRDEARFVFRAVQDLLPKDETPAVVIDLGGGSAQFAVGTARELSWCESIPLGVQRLESIAVKDGEVTHASSEALRGILARELAPIAERIRSFDPSYGFVTSGTGVAVLRILRAQGEIADSGPRVTVERIRALDEKLSRLLGSDRANLPGLEPERMDLIVGGVAFLRVLVDQIHLDALEVSELALRDGVLLSWLDHKAVEVDREDAEGNARRRMALQFAEGFNYDAPHAQHVARLAVLLFDDLRALHGLEDDDRELLEFAALLHDVGFVVSEKGHHRHSEYLILNGLTGFSDIEVRRIAAIARYHRKGGPKSSHTNWAGLDGESREKVRKASSLIRIADGLDRGHLQTVTGLRARVGDGGMRVELQAREDAELEIWAAEKKSDLFVETFAMPVEFVHVLTATEPEEGGLVTHVVGPARKSER